MLKEIQNINSIIEGCRQNDRKAQETLYKSFYDSMMNLCIRYTQSETDARQVLNNGFFKVFKNIEQYNPERSTLYTWIRKIIINCCLDHISAKQETNITIELDNEVEELGIEPETNIKMSVDEILHFVKGLNATTQCVFNMYVIDGFSHKEIAGQLQISEGTSKWYLNEARKKLKAKILQTENNSL